MIDCFNYKINSFNEKSLKNFSSHNEKNLYIQSLMPDITDISENICPCCHAKNKLIKYGKYERNLSILEDNEVNYYRVYVQRVMCKSCGHTHSLLPNFIVPYKIMALFSIAEIVQRASISSAYKLAEIINLSVQMIYTYIAIALAFFADFKILNNTKEYVCPRNFNEKYFLLSIINLSRADYRLDFFEFYNWLLFMQKFRNNSSPKVHISISKVPPT